MSQRIPLPAGWQKAKVSPSGCTTSSTGLMEDVEKALKGMLAPEFKEEIIGQANVLAVFKITKLGNIAGCRVTSGELPPEW